MEHDKSYLAPFVRRLMPHASEEDILEACDNLHAYLKLLYGVFLRTEAESRAGDSVPPDSDARVEPDGNRPSAL